MLKVDEVIVVEGRYDKNTLSQVIDATIIETSGFGLFNDRAKQKLIRRLAETRGLIILTDSDSAGFVIRNKIKSFVPPQYIKHVYVPEIFGKEKRKSKPSKEGKLGVEGMRPEILEEAFRRAGVLGRNEAAPKESITKTDLYVRGLTGKPNSSTLRKALLDKLDLPEYLSTDALLEMLNILMSRQDFLNMDL